MGKWPKNDVKEGQKVESAVEKGAYHCYIYLAGKDSRSEFGRKGLGGRVRPAQEKGREEQWNGYMC